MTILCSVKNAVIYPYHAFKEERFLKWRGLKQPRLTSDFTKKTDIQGDGPPSKIPYIGSHVASVQFVQNQDQERGDSNIPTKLGSASSLRRSALSQSDSQSSTAGSDNVLLASVPGHLPVQRQHTRSYHRRQQGHS